MPPVGPSGQGIKQIQLVYGTFQNVHKTQSLASLVWRLKQVLVLLRLAAGKSSFSACRVYSSILTYLGGQHVTEWDEGFQSHEQYPVVLVGKGREFPEMIFTKVL